MAIDQGHAVADELSSDVLMRREPVFHNDPMLRQSRGTDNQVRRPPAASGLYDVLDLILDKGIVVDAFVRVSLVGIELLTVDLRVVIASVDTYLRYAEGVERLHMFNPEGSKKLPDVVGAGGKSHALKEGARSLGRALTGKKEEKDEGGEEEDEHGQHEEGVGERLAQGVRHVLKKGVGRIMDRLSGEGSEEGEESGKEDDAGHNRHGREQRHAPHEHGAQQRRGNGKHDRPRSSAHRR